MLRDKTKSISIRRIQILMAVLLLVISLLLLFTTFRTKMGYSRMREYTSDYIVWERDADKLKMASDYMTEQARCFVETGKREYLDNYFTEADVDRRRDKALESIRTIAEGNEAYFFAVYSSYIAVGRAEDFVFCCGFSEKVVVFDE